MAVVCEGCGGWVEPVVDHEAQEWRCPGCGRATPGRLLPLFIVTGASGAGKTAVVTPLRGLLPDWDVFETDILWDSGHDADPDRAWHFARSNWLRIAHSIAQSGRHTILCGTQVPEHIDRCDHRAFFPRVHYLNLHCDDAMRAARLRARPAWRGCDEAFVAEQRNFARWLMGNAETAFDPPLVTIDTTEASVEDVAAQVATWARANAAVAPSDDFAQVHWR